MTLKTCLSLTNFAQPRLMQLKNLRVASSRFGLSHRRALGTRMRDAEALMAGLVAALYLVPQTGRVSILALMQGVALIYGPVGCAGARKNALFQRWYGAIDGTGAEQYDARAFFPVVDRWDALHVC